MSKDVAEFQVFRLMIFFRGSWQFIAESKVIVFESIDTVCIVGIVLYVSLRSFMFLVSF